RMRRRRAPTASRQELAERAEQRRDRTVTGRVAHETDAPSFARELAQPATDLDAVGLEQALAQRGVVGAFRRPRRGQLGELSALLGRETEAEIRQLRVQARTHAPVP